MWNPFRLLAAPVICLGLAGSFSGSLAHAEDAPAPGPSTAPATAPSDAAAVISPEASKILDQVNSAYAALKSLELAGTLSNDLEAGGRKQNQKSDFTASFQSPNKFRHAMQDDLLAGSTGQKTFAYLKSKNAFTSAAAPADRVASADLPKPLPQILEMQNPSLQLAIAKSARGELTEHATKISTDADTTLGGTAYQTLVVDKANKLNVRLLIDSQTHLIRQSRTDIRSLLEANGVPDVKSASYTVDYTASKADAPTKDDQFAWAAPENARDLASSAAPSEQEFPALGLVGKPAPAFKLEGLDGKSIALADLKGSVFIVDFWATWCGPCRQSLPHLNKLYDDQKAAGLKVFAVNLMEDKPTVQKFVDSTKLGIPVLLDTKGDTAHDYLADSIPETVLVGKDGKILKVLIGAEPENEKIMRDAVAAALKQ